VIFDRPLEVGLFGLFGKARKARRGDDHVWATDTARRAGLTRDAQRLADGGASVLLVTLSPAALDGMMAALQVRSPLACRDVFGQAALRARLSQPLAMSVALASALPKPAAGERGDADAPTDSSPVPAEILVCGRNERRDADEAVVAFADTLGPRSRVTFHLSFDDPLLNELTGRVRELMLRLGMTDDGPVVHRMLTQSIERAQRRA
jgi:hypothetical protein